MPRQLTMEERDRLAQLRGEECSPQEIAMRLGRSPSTIGRELKRHRVGGEYLPAQAHELAKRRRRERPLTRKLDRPETNELVKSGLAQQWSPDQISGRLKREHPHHLPRQVSATTIDTWIDRQGPLREHWKRCLRRRGKRPCRRSQQAVERREPFGLIHRPDVINRRERLGDLEGDLVLGKSGTGGLFTAVDRRSRYTRIEKVDNKNAKHVYDRVKKVFHSLPATKRHSITFDNGTEFSRCPLLEKHHTIDLYLAEPGCPYQRGTNENTNGLIRQSFPKGTDFRTVTPAEVKRVEHLLNNRPRACLKYRTPVEVFFAKPPHPNCDSD